MDFSRATILISCKGIKQGWLGYDLSTNTARIWDSGNARYSCNTLRQIARGLVKALEHPEDTANRAIFIASFTTTNNEVLAALENASRKKWTVVPVDGEKEIADGQAKREKGDFMGSMAQNLCATCESCSCSTCLQHLVVLELFIRSMSYTLNQSSTICRDAFGLAN
jgi:hypothetical protein